MSDSRPGHSIEKGTVTAATVDAADRGQVSPGRAAALTPGTIFGRRYRIVAPVGRGGMGEVYRADDLKIGQAVALKFLPGSVASDRSRLDLLFAEVRVGREVSHPNLCRLFDCAEADGRHYIVMEYVDGEDLASLLKRIGRLPVEKAFDVARGLGAGLAALHAKGILHRDLKPANVLIDGRGQARLSDFGLAIPAEDVAGAGVCGTPAYMAPEQLAGAAATTRSDLYAFGLVLYEMLAGKRPFEAGSLEELRTSHAGTPPSLRSGVPEVDPLLERLVLQCLEKDPSARPPSVAAVLAALPGGDPLDAAVAGGETPSPEMVAASGAVGDLRTGAAWALLAATLAGLWLEARGAERGAPFRPSALPKPPEVLAEKARDVLREAGWSEPPFETAAGFFLDRAATPRFYYRQSPGRFRAALISPAGMWAPGRGPGGTVTPDDPTLAEPGEARVVLDPEGGLVEMRVVPPAAIEAPGATDASWAKLFAAAGLDRAGARQIPAGRIPPVSCDARSAWRVDGQGREGGPLSIEAASVSGRPVWFSVVPDSLPTAGPRQAEVQAERSHIAVVVWSAELVLVGLGTVVLARRNLRLGRVDLASAWRLATACFVLLSFGYLLRMHLHGFLAADWEPVLTAFLLSAAWALVAWGLYVGVEPHVRRRWPRALVSWTRLLSGRARDPMVGRDVLVGAFLALVARLLGALLGVGLPADGVDTIVSLRRVAGIALPLVYAAVVIALGMLVVSVVLRALLRREWRALLAVAILLAVPALAAHVWSGGLRAVLSSPGLYWLFWGVVMATALVRFGLQTTATALYVTGLLEELPIALDVSAWYGTQAGFGLAVVAAAAVAGFVVSLGGKPLLGRSF